MPNTYNVLDREFKLRHAMEQKQAEELLEKQFAAINAVIRARLNAGCRSLTCIGCGNIDCVIAAKEYRKLWPEEKTEILNQSQPAFHADMPEEKEQERESLPSAELQNCQEQEKSKHPGQDALGLNLFNLPEV